MSTEAATFLGIAIIAFFVIAGTKNAISYLAEDRSSTLIRIHPRNMKSISGMAVVTDAYYYKPREKYTANVKCDALEETRFIVEDTMTRLEEKIHEALADFDKRITKE